ncbi:UpxZ family transcription anti-terminator antagonist [Bacteroides sp.]|uniref:UpxZ family transcription anti-terminator antagonist n=1 Tax=Bacteroides sp. TaxID=29523 RepID=UPI002610D062|nr:UpxZ family transcription anti-terminator antagonist [Bacteroides sp.]MDD3038185.1 UpxZ family transcription anti-terminator antagonist [Bacteroides sp.]
MDTIILQEKIENLLSATHKLLPVGSDMENIYADDLSFLNKSIHDQMNELYSQQGRTIEQEATLCLALLMGYSVSMYANPEDELKKQTVLLRTWKILSFLPPSSLKEQLLSAYNGLQHLFEIN